MEDTMKEEKKNWKRWERRCGTTYRHFTPIVNGRRQTSHRPKLVVLHETRAHKQTNKHKHTDKINFLGLLLRIYVVLVFFTIPSPPKRIAVKFAMHRIQTQQTNWIECDSSVLNRIHFNLGTLCRTSTFKHDDSFFFFCFFLFKC